jgi:hypothetical protein
MRKYTDIYNYASKTYAKPNPAMQRTIAPISTSARKRGKTPRFTLFIETEKYDW